MDFNWHWTLDFLGRRASFAPHQPAVIEADRNRTHTYRELDRRAEALASYFTAEAGLRRGDRVAVLARNCVEYLDFFFAAVKTGTILVPLNIRLSVTELSAMLTDTAPRLLAYEDMFSDTAAALEAETIEKRLLLKKSAKHLELPAEDYDAVLERVPPGRSKNGKANPEDPLLILFTGGTTGPPKGAVISHRAVFFNLLSEALSWQLGQKTIIPNLLPFFHTGGWHIGTLPTLFAGGRVILNPAFDPELTLKLVEEHQCAFLFAAATMYRMISSMENFGKTNLSSLQFVMSGAAPCPASVMEPFWNRGVIFVQGYGITEGGPNNLFMPWSQLGWDQIREKNQSVGLPFLYCRARLVTDEGDEAPAGEPGELLLGGPTVFSGYWNKPQESQDTLRQGWVYTGDIARRDEEGFFYIADRKKDMYISGGENVFPVEVEAAICAYPGVQEAAVIGIPDEKWGETGKAFIVTKAGAALEAQEIRAFLETKLARYKIPRAIKFVDSIPKSAVGKVLKRVLAELTDPRNGRSC